MSTADNSFRRKINRLIGVTFANFKILNPNANIGLIESSAYVESFLGLGVDYVNGTQTLLNNITENEIILNANKTISNDENTVITGVFYSETTVYYILIGNNSTSQIVATSLDGITWNLQSTTIMNGSVRSIKPYQDIIIAGGYNRNTGLLSTSSDYGLTWTTTVFEGRINYVYVVRTVIFLVGTNSSYGFISRSTDALTWSNTIDDDFLMIEKITSTEEIEYNYKLFIYGYGGTPVVHTGLLKRSSDDGITWNTITLNFSTSEILCMAVSSLILLIGGRDNLNNGFIATSDDNGVRWTKQTCTFFNGGTVYSILSVYNGQLLYAVGDNGSNGVIATSTNGVTWTLITTCPYFNDGRIFSITRTYDNLMTVSGYTTVNGVLNGVIATNPDDGDTWTLQEPPLFSGGSASFLYLQQMVF